MTRRFRVAIAGCGKIAVRHVEACLLSPQVELVALVDPTLERASELAGKFGIDPGLFANLEKVLGNVDGVIIAAPNNFHRSLAIQCAAAGVHVLIEKPIAGSSEDSDAICAAHEKSGTVCAVGFVTRFRDNNRQMYQLIKSGYFGEVEEFAYQFGSRGGWAPLSAYNLDKHATGGGVVVVTGSHFLDRMLHWFGEPDDCGMWSDAQGGPEANALTCFRFQRGESSIFGSARFSKSVALAPRFVMRTSQGIVLLEDTPNARIQFSPAGSPVDLSVNLNEKNDNIFRAQIEDFATACLSGGPPAVSGREAARSVFLTEQLYERCHPLDEAPRSGRLEQRSVIHD
ncbi:MAG: Gfo/Idh/MocA family oxidoreductase [Planctomycetales bacterium]|nr:Gfo/Idh/MocA family oxidoreductase [Planctomycetales bacterium]